MSEFWDTAAKDQGGQLTEETLIGAMVALQRQSNRQHAIFMSAKQSKAYKRFLAKIEAWRAELATTPRHRLVKRYKLQRKLGRKRAAILTPHPIYWRVNRMRLNWKYRNDPDW